MKHITMAVAAFAVLAIGSARAAEVTWPTAQWRGPYVGVLGGASWGASRHTYENSPFDSGSFNVSGGLVGVSVGDDWQQGSWVFGLTGDIAISGVGGTTPGTISACTTPCLTNLKWLGTARVRAGYDFRTFAPYLTGGLAISGVESGDTGAPFIQTDTRTGWALGGGIDVPLRQGWSIDADVLYVDFGSANGYTYTSASAPDVVTLSTTIFEIALHKRLGSP